MALEFRRGKEAIAEANESSKNGSFSPFLPNFYWKDDKQSRLLWILNPLEDIPMVRMIKPFTTDKRTEFVVARQDDAIGASSDPIEDEWGYGPADSNVCIAVELKAVMEVRHGRERPTSFEVETREFTRRVRDAKGELTDAKEEAVAPSVGFICQSPSNFFNHVAHKDGTVAPIHQFALQIVRNGGGTDTDYEIELFENQELDVSGLLENWEDISYLTEDEKDEVSTLIEQAEDDEEIVSIIGAALLDKWLNEHATDEWYSQVAHKIDTPAKYPSKKFREANGEDKKEKAPKRDLPVRTSSRRSRRADPEATAEVEADDTSVKVEETQPPETEAMETETPIEEPKVKRARRKSKTDEEEPAPEPVTKSSPIKERMEMLRAGTAAAARNAA
jgi:hypothetical protein